MDNNALNEFKTACKEYLQMVSLNDLRIYGRTLNMKDPTKLKKPELLQAIVDILSGEAKPEGRNNRGAPIKNKTVSVEITASIEALRKRYLEPDTGVEMDWLDAMRLGKFPGSGSNLVFKSNNATAESQEDWIEQAKMPVIRGQLQFLNQVPRLLPLSCGVEEEPIVVPTEFIREYNLREGDVLAGHTVKANNVSVLKNVLTVNELQVSCLDRDVFETGEVTYPDQILSFTTQTPACLSAKYMQWLLPIYQGQRGCVVAPLKAGKTQLIYELASYALRSARDCKVFVLLNGQTPENVWSFRNAFPDDRLVYTTYDDTPEKQVFAAEFLLKRAKRLVESGKNVLLFVDSFNALARAYNETEESSGGKLLAGGLESKTLQYLRRFFGSARRLKSGGALTILGTLACDTGSPFDELVSAELTDLANYQLHLSGTLAANHVYPAIDLMQSGSRTVGEAADRTWERVRQTVYREFLPNNGEEKLRAVLEQADSYASFLDKIGVKL